MLKSRTLTIEIARPAEDVYNFLADPANLASWTMVRKGERQPLAGANSWMFEGPRGTVLVHFTPHNPFFVLDYTTTVGTRVTHLAHARVIRSGDGKGTVLVHTSVQPPTVSDAAFASEEEWMMADLLVLKTLMEGK